MNIQYMPSLVLSRFQAVTHLGTKACQVKRATCVNKVLQRFRVLEPTYSFIIIGCKNTFLGEEVVETVSITGSLNELGAFFILAFKRRKIMLQLARYDLC